MESDMKDSVLFSMDSLPLQSTCANCSQKLSADSFVAFFTLPTITMSVYQGLELVFKCREVTADEVMPNLLKLCASCGHVFGKTLKWYQRFISDTVSESYVKQMIYGDPSGVDASSLVKVEAEASTDEDDLNTESINEPELDWLDEGEPRADGGASESDEVGSMVTQSTTRVQKKEVRKRKNKKKSSNSLNNASEDTEDLSTISEQRAISPESEEDADHTDDPERQSGDNENQIGAETRSGRMKLRSRKKYKTSKPRTATQNSHGVMECKVCDKTFTKKIRLKMHEATHTGLRPHQCSYCDFNFREKKSLDRHILRAHPKYVYSTHNKRIFIPTPEDEVLLATSDYKCDHKDCVGVSFPTFKEWVLHQHSVHSLDTGYDLESTQELYPKAGKLRPCPRCGRKAPSQPKMLLHIKTVHLRLKQFSCDCCGRDFASRLGLKWHKKSAHDGTPNKYVCNICGNSFTGKSCLDEHETVEHPELRPFYCEEEGCRMMLRSRDALRHHIRRMHPDRHVKKILSRRKARDMTEEEAALIAISEYKCDSAKCPGVSFTTFKDWVLHQEKAHNLRTGYNLEATGTLVPTHGKVRPCPQCGKKFKGPFLLLSHIQSFHLRTGRVPCETCGRDFVNELSLKQHRAVTHDGNAQKFLCSLCGASFNSNGYLRQHEEIHTGQLRKAKECDICGARFRRKYNLDLHKVTEHSQGEPSVCDICGKVFKVKQRMEVHKRRQHVKKDIIDQICEICGKGYAFKHYLKDHLVSVHKLSEEEARKLAKVKQPAAIRQYTIAVKPKTCEYCGRKYVRREQLFTHLMSVHGKTKEEATEITGLETKRELIPGGDGRSRRLKRKSDNVNVNPEKEIIQPNLPTASTSANEFDPRSRLSNNEMASFHHLHHHLPFYLN